MKINTRLINIFIAFAFGAFLLLSWEYGLLHKLLNLRAYQLPVPTEIASILVEESNVILKNTICTLNEALVGLTIGSIYGFVLAVIATLYPKWGSGSLALATAFNAVPMIAMAPIMNNWFGMDVGSKIAVVTVFSMASMSINAYRGMNILKPFALDLMKSYVASKKDLFLKLQLPNCIPNVLTALKISTTTSMMAAICSEFFSSFQGIGFELSTVLKLAKMDLAWAYIVVAAACGIVLYSIVSMVERYAIQWHASQR